MPDRPQVFASFLQFLSAFAQTLGVPRAELLAAAQVDPEALGDPDAWIDYEALIRAWGFLLERFPDQPLGITYSRMVRPEITGVVGYACANARDLGQALSLWIRYATLLDPYFVVDVQAQGETSRPRLQHEPTCSA